MNIKSRLSVSSLFLLLVFFLISCSSGQEDPRTASPESQGVSSTDILRFLNEIDRLNQEAFDGDPRDEIGFHSIMILRHGKVITEGWWAPYERIQKHRLYSLSKSFTSTAAGLAINEGLFSLSDPVVSFFPDVVPEQISPQLASMTVHHLLSMSTGQESENRENEDWAEAFLAIPVEHDPGSVFKYNTMATFMVSAIVQRTSGQSLMEFLTPRLFEPLGIEGASWLKSPKGYDTGGFGLNVKTEGHSKIWSALFAKR